MQLLVDIIDKFAPFLKHAFVSFVFMLLLLAYTHNIQNEQLNTIAQSINSKINNIAVQLEKHILSADFKLGKLEGDISALQLQLAKAQQDIMFLDRFVARAETHIQHQEKDRKHR